MTDKEQIDRQISELNDWRGELYARLRKLVNETDPRLQETFKWFTAVWKLNTNICAVSTFKDHVKINFFKGSTLTDSDGLFNNGLDSKNHRSIDFAVNSEVDEAKIRRLLEQAIAHDS